jgi:nucleotide-binding universal stress UspA family protein
MGAEMIRDHAGWTGYHLNVRDRPHPGTAPATEVVAALDGSADAERSLEVADALAAVADLPLRLLTVRATSAELSPANSYLARVARRAPRVSDLTVDVAPDPAVALAAAADGGALVVLATHARRAAGEVLFGSVADRVLRGTERAVVLVGPSAAAPDPSFRTMVVPDDGGLGGRRLRPVAQAWCEHLDAVPWVVQVLPGQGVDAGLDVLESAHVRHVASRMGPSAEWEVLHGSDPAQRIVAFSIEQRAGLISMAVPVRHRLGPDTAGGVALQVVRHAPCPVLALGRLDH